MAGLSFRDFCARTCEEFDSCVFVLKGSHVLSVAGRRHVPRVQYGGPKTWRWRGRTKMAAVCWRERAARVESRPLVWKLTC